MTQARPAMPMKIPGSTRDILVGLYANLMKIDPPTEKNITLERAIKYIDQPVASKREALFTTPNRLIDTANSLDKSIERLTAQDKNLVKDNRYAEIAAQLRQRAVAINQKEDELKAEYHKLVEEQTKVIRELLLADMQGEKISPQKMVNLEIRQKGFTKSVNEYFDEHRKIQRELDELHKEVYSRIKDKRDLPMPEQEKLAQRRAAPAA